MKKVISILAILFSISMAAHADSNTMNNGQQPMPDAKMNPSQDANSMSNDNTATQPANGVDTYDEGTENGDDLGSPDNDPDSETDDTDSE